MKAEDCRAIEPEFLREIPMPALREGSKEHRGRVTVIGGSREVPGAVLLAGLGALRAGAGKLQIATVESRAPALGLALPEALVMELPETLSGGIHRAAFRIVERRCRSADVLLIGPGMLEERDGDTLVAELVAKVREPALVIDAGALPALYDSRTALRARNGRVVITPHSGEMAGLLGCSREEVEADPLLAAVEVAEALHLVVAMKGAKTFVAEPSGNAWCFHGGGIGLGTSGSGDVLAGIMAGLLARGAAPAAAACRGVFLHGEAGAQLARSVGTLGYLAREILDRIPPLMEALDGTPSATHTFEQLREHTPT